MKSLDGSERPQLSESTKRPQQSRNFDFHGFASTSHDDLLVLTGHRDFAVDIQA